MPDEIIRALVDCGLHAPSSKDDQPWRIHVVAERHRLDAVAQAMVESPRRATYVPLDPRTGLPHARHASSVAESARVLTSVPLGLFVENRGGFSGGRRSFGKVPGALDESLIGLGFEYLGLGAAIQNMWLAAHGRGLAGVFIGDVVIAEVHVRDALGLAGDLVGVLALGYSHSPPHAPRHLKEGRGPL